jgi:hypothetical protein
LSFAEDKIMSRPLYRRVAVLCFVVSAVLLCVGGVVAVLENRSKLGAVVPVSGKVTVEEEPLEEGTITFIPDPGKGNTSVFFATGVVENGTYQVSTEGKDGVPPGWYKVIVYDTTLAKLPTAGVPPSRFHRRFSDPDRTPLSIQVMESGAKSYDFVLTER